MYLAYISKKRDVEKFLDELHAFINREDFDIAKDFFLNIAGDSKRERSFSIKYTMYKLVQRFVNNYTNRVGCGFECAGIKTQA